MFDINLFNPAWVVQPNHVKPHLHIRRGGTALNIIERLAAQDETALQALMEQYGDYLMRTAYLLLKDRQAAEEAVQDTFIQAFRKIHQLKEPGKIKGWLLQITVNHCRMKQRLWSWKRLLPFPRMELMLDASDELGPEELLLLQWRNKRLSEAIHSLEYHYREVITLYYYNEWSIAEIAGSLQLNENTIKARLARGRMQLKHRLEAEENLR